SRAWWRRSPWFVASCTSRRRWPTSSLWPESWAVNTARSRTECSARTEAAPVFLGVNILQHARIAQFDDAHGSGVLLNHRPGTCITVQGRELRPELATEQYRVTARALV